MNRRREITMDDAEVAAFLAEERTATLCTIHADGSIHAVAMWYGLVGAEVVFETKARSQKVANVRRDPRTTVLVEAGTVYDELRGVELVGTAEVVEDADRIWAIGMSVWERNFGPYDDSQRQMLEAMLNKRVGIVVHPHRAVTWDHRKLPGG